MESTIKVLRQTLAVGALLLTAATWHLWLPQTLFPRVPLFDPLADWPQATVAIINWLALFVWVGSAAAMLLPRLNDVSQRVASLFYVAGLLVLVALDQHRLQPWAVHIAVSLLLLVFSRARHRLTYLTIFTVSIYVYSALGKFDAQFLHTVGQEFLASGMRLMGFSARALTPEARFWLASLFPIGELLCGLGLAWVRLRKVTAVAAIMMHLALILVLGPLGLGHQWGVLLWNALFIAINVLLFIHPDLVKSEPRIEPSRNRNLETIEQRADASTPKSVFALAILLLATCVPLCERLGWSDHWLGWALYAPHSSRARVYVSSAAIDRLPPVVRRFVNKPSESESLWCEVRLDRWSLETLDVPIYPQQRFSIGVARALGQRLDNFEIRVDALSMSNRWSGRRNERALYGRTELEAYARRFWFSTRPSFNPSEFEVFSTVN